MSWARLLKRVFDIDIERCRHPMSDDNPSPAGSPADLVLLNGRIASQDDRQSFVSCKDYS